MKKKIVGVIQVRMNSSRVPGKALLELHDSIEGENLNVESVRSSLAKRLGVNEAGLSGSNAQTEGLADLLLDATKNHQQALTLDRLYQWHCYLFTEPPEGEFRLAQIRVGALRGEDLMQVVFGPLQKRTVHFEVPPKFATNVNASLRGLIRTTKGVEVHLV